ncbi:MAG: hypothetical protein AAGK05_15610, partial [Pseudomonadota bacterium]
LAADIRSLFTNIPVDETIDIICDTWYRIQKSPPKVASCAVSEDNLRSLLDAVTKNVKFAFNNQLFCQIDGLAMGSPLSGSFADVFVGDYERSLLDSRPKKHVIKSYLRFVDDLHIVMHKDGIQSLQNDLRMLHRSLQFTMDEGAHFLDVNIHREAERVKTSVHRKTTFTGLYID